MKKVRIVIFMILLIACQPSVEVPLTATSTPKPTKTPIPPTATVTPFPPLDEEGPYLVLRSSASEFVIYNENGIGKNFIKLPLDGYIRDFGLKNKNISPDGKWLVFYTGSLGDANEVQSLPIALYLLNLSDETIIKVTDILDNTEKISFYLSSIYLFAWSPDSHYLAFVGLLNGESTDVYLYDTESQKIQKVNDDNQDVAGVRWSPDGSYIILENVVLSEVYTTTSLHFIKPSDKTIKTPRLLWESNWGGIVDWLSPDTVLMTGATDTAGLANLDLLNISTGKIKEIWGELYGETAIDHQNQIIAMSTTDFVPPENPGIYFIDFNGNKNLALNGYYYNLAFRGGNKNRFLALEYSLTNGADLKSISLDGTTSTLEYFENYKISISPDYSWLIIYNDKNIHLYDESDKFIADLRILGINSINWRPDSQGFFYTTGKELYYFDMQEEISVFVDICIIEDCSFRLDENNSIWLP